MTDLTYYINPANVKQHLETKEYFPPMSPDWHLYFYNKVVSCSVKYILPHIKHSVLWILVLFPFPCVHQNLVYYVPSLSLQTVLPMATTTPTKENKLLFPNIYAYLCPYECIYIVGISNLYKPCVHTIKNQQTQPSNKTQMSPFSR